MTLTIQDLGALGELLGSVAVLFTLVYLALQTRQNTMAIGAQLDAAVIVARQDLALSVATSSDLAEALREDFTVGQTTNEVRMDAYWRSLLLNVEWQHDQARRGLLPSFDEVAIAVAIHRLFAISRGFEGWWERTKAGLSPDFVEWVEEQRSKAA